ncbi:MAG: hypothetical protein PSV13_20950 [Lacunisphaera sp.]|nr:hypothetical protein [Lacunisphaera sp.]
MIMTGHAPAALLHEIHAESCRWIKQHIEQVDIGLRHVPGHGIEPVPAG